jgi:hypothetical protein
MGTAEPVSATPEAGASVSDAPHSPQNRTPGSLAAPHVGQPRDRRAPHSPQNFRPASFAVPHLEQFN